MQPGTHVVDQIWHLLCVCFLVHLRSWCRSFRTCCSRCVRFVNSEKTPLFSTQTWTLPDATAPGSMCVCVRAWVSKHRGANMVAEACLLSRVPVVKQSPWLHHATLSDLQLLFGLEQSRPHNDHLTLSSTHSGLVATPPNATAFISRILSSHESFHLLFTSATVWIKTSQCSVWINRKPNSCVVVSCFSANS